MSPFVTELNLIEFNFLIKASLTCLGPFNPKINP